MSEKTLYPEPQPIMASEATLRDCFAWFVPTTEVQEILYRHLSTTAQEILTGKKEPKLDVSCGPEGDVNYQLDKLKFICAVNAAIRYALADAMLEARNK